MSVQERETRRAGGDIDPAYKAVLIHKKRMAGEYLLRELATAGFLSGYGFPTDIVSFDNLTVSLLKKIKAQKEEGREDNRYRRRELASRDRVTALREYAPGSELVMDGLVYRSAGITLNWHIPADQQEAQEIQDIRYAWRCHHCGASGSSHSRDVSRHCQVCGKDILAENMREFVEPAGFSVDLYKDPHNDVTSQHFVPVEAPWISVQADWHFLANPMLGRFRATPHGHVFHQSRGIHGEGYALCLVCGRAQPMTPEESLPKGFQPHSKLRGGREGDAICAGSHDQWKIKTGLTLGHETFTDALELQLRTENGIWLQGRVAAMTLAVALRDATAEWLGVQATELSCDVKEAKPEPGVKCQSILIYDRFAAGYASSAERFIAQIFRLARERLQCSPGCDSACPHCVLDFDQRFAADYLDRHTALAVLTENWIRALSLPENLAYFGPSSRPEYARLSEAIWREAGHAEGGQTRLFAGGAGAEWDVGASPLRHLAYRLAGQERDVQIVLPKNAIESTDNADLHLLASLLDHPRINVLTVSELPFANSGAVLAEVGGGERYTRWACDDLQATTFGMSWGVTSNPLIRGAVSSPLILAGQPMEGSALRPHGADAGDKELVVHHELDGLLQGFGQRFWTLIADQHGATRTLLSKHGKNVVSIRYQDRYLFTPLSLAVLVELVHELCERVGHEGWSNPPVLVVTSRQRGSDENMTWNVVWANWPDIDVRDQVVVHAFDYLGIDVQFRAVQKSSIQHARLLEVDFDGGARLSLRLDQGVSYWRAATSAQGYPSQWRFDFGLDPKNQGACIAEMQVQVEGAIHPTEIFVKVR